MSGVRVTNHSLWSQWDDDTLNRKADAKRSGDAQDYADRHIARKILKKQQEWTLEQIMIKKNAGMDDPDNNKDRYIAIAISNRIQKETREEVREQAEKAMANLSMNNSSNHTNNRETANNDRNQEVLSREPHPSARHHTGKRDRSASRTRKSKKPATDSTKTGTSKTSSSNPPTTGSLHPPNPPAASSSNSRKHPTTGSSNPPTTGSLNPPNPPASSSSKPPGLSTGSSNAPNRFITSPSNSRIHPTTGSLHLPKPPAPSSSDSRKPPITGSSNAPKPPTASSSKRPIPSTSAPTPKPTKPTTVVVDPSNSTSGSGPKPMTEEELYKQDANGLYSCKKGCVDRVFNNPNNRKRHYDERHSENTPAFPCPLGTVCTDIVFLHILPRKRIKKPRQDLIKNENYKDRGTTALGISIIQIERTPRSIEKVGFLFKDTTLKDPYLLFQIKFTRPE
ncbi:hypothetical protein BCON_0251g00170 [Botryotinia convoluta]|uniref:Uncharacterized protein n=1 Tax=Botryotinia convoluta TaxID=54673 RepID=A0A4Z1HGE5_9HELO|nr:hypothetical protein BCON_0251g00170 [Botryotinia convoluta]